MTFKEKLKYLRKINNMSQEELAEKLTVSRQTVSRWETGDSMPDAEMLIHLSDVFSVSVDELLKEDKKIDGNSQMPTTKNINSRIGVVCGICVISFSAIVLLSLGILSSVFPVYVGRSINDGKDIMYKADIFSFLDEHNLKWLFAVMIGASVFGAVLICVNKITQKKRNSEIK